MLNDNTASMLDYEPGSYVPNDLNPKGFKSVLDVLDYGCERFAQLPAFTSLGRTITYGELKQKADAFASYLQHYTDLKPGDRIAVQLPNVIQFPIAVFGAMQAGLVVVNTNPLYTPKELQHQFNDSGAKAVVVFANMAANVEKILANTQVRHVIVTEIADLHSPLKRVLVNSVVKYIKKMVPAYQLPSAKTFNEVLSLGAKKAPHPVVLAHQDLAVLQYTGGTTGVAKGAMLTHANLIANMHQLKGRLEELLNEGEEIFIAPLPLYHIYAFLIHALTLLEFGAHSILIPNPRDLPAFIKELRKWRFTGFIGLNTLFAGLCNRDDFKTLDFSGLKLTASGGMPLTHAAADRWKEVTGCVVTEGYGLTETSPVVAFNPVGSEQIGTIGVAVDHTDIKIIDDDGNDVNVGEPGMLCVRGPQVMRGYWNREKATEEVMTHDGYLITGDVALAREDGYLQIVDRAKDLIIVSGFNVYPTEVEDVLTQCPDVLEAAAIGIEDEKTGEAVKAFLVMRDGVEPDMESIRALCRESLAAYKVPRHFEVRNELPKTNVGKVLRRALREPS
ncbi:long-chain fatty acid--CoA ligase [Marinomonas piezotolerans]|uniref:Long-chain-fatty-acid--CoA ligase n=1 Tax=Marinomonas piezotolerans TaxID=2213058 RepID=A0A370U6U0_9GAMM|nr:AMP-binding protein [Marinomonas piezotolerans]RDL43494.1 long-chain fatty acid--CoA ligase [Marinomonas piezotolerans]